jgi:hypothetical protein
MRDLKAHANLRRNAQESDSSPLVGSLNSLHWQKEAEKSLYTTFAEGSELEHDNLRGTSITEDNVQLMCARHNLQKGAKIT